MKLIVVFAMNLKIPKCIDNVDQKQKFVSSFKEEETINDIMTSYDNDSLISLPNKR